MNRQSISALAGEIILHSSSSLEAFHFTWVPDSQSIDRVSLVKLAMGCIASAALGDLQEADPQSRP